MARRRQDATMRDRYGRAPRCWSHPLTGIVVRGMYARVVQEPGMESRRSAAARNDTARDTEPVGRREVGARNRSKDVGGPAPGNPAEQRSAPENRLVGGRR